MSDVMTVARDLEERGLVVVPVHSVGPDRKTCSCPKGANCGKDAGKHPRGDGWQEQDGGVASIEASLERYKRANIGVLVDASDVVVVDIDPRSGGDVTMAAFVKEHGPMPRTRVVRTGSDGWHYYFKKPAGVEFKGKLGKGIDFKKSGIVVAEGSTSWSGNYTLFVDAPIAELPDWILEEASKPDSARIESVEAPRAAPDPDDPDLPRRQTYCTAAIRAEVARLDAMEAAKTPGGVGYEGEDWNQTTYNVACNIFEFANTPEADLSSKEAVDLILDHAPRDENFGDAEILKIIESARDRVGSSGRSVPPPPVDPFGVAPDVSQGPPSPLALMQGLEWKDVDIAAAFARYHLDDLRYVEGLGYHIWDASRGVWEAVPDTRVLGLSMAFAKELSVEAAMTGDSNLAKKGAARLTSAAVNSTVNLVKGRPEIAQQVADLDADVELLNAPNGYVNLRTGDLIEHNPDKMMTKSTGCAYNPDATHPDLEKALEALHPEERDWLQVAFGQALTGSPPAEDFLLILHGIGANGKSALVGTLLEVAGSYGTMLSERVIIANDAAHSTDMTDLLGVRVAVLEELPESGNLNSKRIKSIVGTRQMKARKIRQDNIQWEATHTVFITTNHLPRITETDHGLWRRLALLNFPFRFVPDAGAVENDMDRVGDIGLRHRLTLGPQKEAFLAWAVQGAVKYLQDGEKPFSLTSRMEGDKAEWRHGMDPTGRFIDEMIEFDPMSMIPCSDLYDEFKSWLTVNGHTPWSSQLATSRIESHHVVLSNSARRAQTRVGANGVEVSYRPSLVRVNYADGQKVRAWVGMKWKEGA